MCYDGGRVFSSTTRRHQKVPAAANRYQGKLEAQPILFIASYLGGILLMKALEMDSWNEAIFPSEGIRAVSFALPRPFRETSLQDVALWADAGLRVWASIQGRKVTKLLGTLRPRFLTLRNLYTALPSRVKSRNIPARYSPSTRKAKRISATKYCPLAISLVL